MVDVFDGSCCFPRIMPARPWDQHRTSWTPRMFSFNSPYGAVPHLYRHGHFYELDEDLVIPDKSNPSVGRHQGLRLGQCRRGQAFPDVFRGPCRSLWHFRWIRPCKDCRRTIHDIFDSTAPKAKKIKMTRAASMAIGNLLGPRLKASSTT